MKTSKNTIVNTVSSIFTILIFSLWLTGCNGISMRGNNYNYIGVSITCVHHIGPDFNITDFYVDGYSGSNVGRGGGGGRYVCCAMLPSKWRPDLSVEVRWSIANWSKEITEETKKVTIKILCCNNIRPAFRSSNIFLWRVFMSISFQTDKLELSLALLVQEVACILYCGRIFVQQKSPPQAHR
jgi:hypothetical protein